MTAVIALLQEVWMPPVALSACEAKLAKPFPPSWSSLVIADITSAMVTLPDFRAS